MATEALRQAIASTRAVMSAVQPDQLAAQSPCTSWKVSDVINHVIGSHYFFTGALNGQAPEGEPPDFAAGDYLAAYDDATAQTLAAYEADGALDKTVSFPFGDLPAAAVVGLAATDTFTHGWDIARTSGQSTDLSPELAAELLERAKATIPDAFRGEEGKAPFGPEQQAPEGASAADQLAAFLGRSV